MFRDHQSEGIRAYEAVCIVSLAALLVLLLRRGMGNLALLPLLLGLGGLVARGRWSGKPLVLWRTAPFLLVMCLAILLFREGLSFFILRVSPLEDALLALAVLGYVAGHYRLQGLDTSPLPADPRQHRPPPPSRRAVPARELLALALELVISVCLAVALWERLPAWRRLGMDPEAWRLLLLIWIIGAGVLLTATVLSYLGRLLWTRPEAELLLQDVLWKETRREQRRIGRWLAWHRKRQNS